MNKSDLIEAVASQLESSRTDASAAVEAVLAAIGEGVRRDDKVALAGFGTFQKKTRAARQGINPATREPIQIAASTTCSFKPASALKDTL